jgi:hypothetical protein
MIKPNFLYVGAAKSGSTWLYKALQQHPEVFVPQSKELFFFDRYFDRGTDWYFEKFYLAPDSATAIGEISHDYMYHPNAAERIKTVLGDHVKLIFFLRNPIDKAFSGYLFKLRNGFTTASFEDDLKTSERPLERVCYDGYVKPFLETFDKINVRVFFFEDLTKNPNQLANEVFRFLGVSKLPDRDFSEKVLPASKSRSRILANLVKRTALLTRRIGLEGFVSRIKRASFVNKVLYKPYTNDEKPEIKPETRAELRNRVRDSVIRLNNLIDQDISRKWPEFF